MQEVKIRKERKQEIFGGLLSLNQASKKEKEREEKKRGKKRLNHLSEL
jgi:hypothetical protein